MYSIQWRLNDAGNKDRNKIYWELVFKIINAPNEFVNIIHEKSVVISFHNGDKIEKWQMCISNTPNIVQPKDMPWWNKTFVDYNGIRKVYLIVNGKSIQKYKKEFGDHLKSIFADSDRVDHDGIIQIKNNIIYIELN